MFVGVDVDIVVFGAIGGSEAMGTVISWVYVVGGGTTVSSVVTIGTHGGGCMIWKVGCSDSSDAGGNGSLRGTDGSEGGAGGSGWGASGTTTGAGTDSTCILFEQCEYLKLKMILL